MKRSERKNSFLKQWIEWNRAKPEPKAPDYDWHLFPDGTMMQFPFTHHPAFTDLLAQQQKEKEEINIMPETSFIEDIEETEPDEIDEEPIEEESEVFFEKQKYCPKCKQIKPLSLFHRNRARKDGHSSACAECETRRISDYKKK